MENNNIVIEALGKVPELVTLSESAIQQNERILAAFSKLMERNLQAEIPDEEVTDKVITPLTNVIRSTPCAAPDLSKASDLIAKGVLEMVRSEVNTSVREAVKDTPIILEHHHTHTTALGLMEYANEKVKSWLCILVILCSTLLLGLISSAVWYYNSDAYWGQQYVEIATSKYATQAEKDMLWAEIYAESALPKGYSKNPSYFRAKIKQNKKTLEERRRKGKDKNGNYFTSVPLER